MWVVVEVVVKPQGKIDHFFCFGYDLGLAAEAGEKVTDVAVVLLDQESQVFAGKELVFRDAAVIAFPVVGKEGFAFETDFGEELAAGFIITATKHPGDGSASDRVIGPPNPELASLFLRKCHISSSVITT